MPGLRRGFLTMGRWINGRVTMRALERIGLGEVPYAEAAASMAEALGAG